MDPGRARADPARPVLPRAVVALGLVSLFTDLSSEMIFSLLPAFLAGRFPSAPLILGAMEGVAQLTASLLKLLSGRWADRARSLKRLVLAGYSVSAAVRPLMALVSAWWQPFLVRTLDRVGKGIRTSPRDAMIARLVSPDVLARAFSLNRGMDHLGAALGAAVALALTALAVRPEHVFAASALPGVMAILVLAFTRDAPVPAPAPAPEGERPGGLGARTDAGVPRSTWRFLVPVALFGLANATDAFVLLWLIEQGAAPALLPFAWLLLHLVKSVASYPAGWLADRLGPRRVVLAGWSLYAVSYLGLSLSTSWRVTLVVIAFYGMYHALSEGAERSLLVALTPTSALGRAFGLYHAISGVVALLAGLLFGGIWTGAGGAVAFLAAAVAAALAVGLLLLLRPRPLASGGALG